MRRNIAPAALVIIPVALAALNPLMMAIANRLTLRDRTPLMIAVAGGIAAVSAFFAFAIVTNRFYYEEERPIRFGIGMSRVGLPIGAADWLDEHLPDARVWTDMASSSTIHFFTRPHRDVPIISNTWAYPPAVMRKVRRLRATRHTVDRLLYEYNADVVVLQYTGSLPLFRALSARPEWRLVHVEGGHVVFARAAGEQAEVVRRAAANLGMPDAAAYVAQQRSLDPSLSNIGANRSSIRSEPARRFGGRNLFRDRQRAPGLGARMAGARRCTHASRDAVARGTGSREPRRLSLGGTMFSHDSRAGCEQ
jgi:hypothetical protein